MLLVIVTLHGLAIFAAWENSLPLVIRGAMVGLVLLHLPLSLRKNWYRPSHRRRWLMYSEATGWRLQAGVGESRAVSLLESSVVTPYLTVLHFRSEESAFIDKLVIFRDSLSADDYRQLRVAARVSAG